MHMVGSREDIFGCIFIIGTLKVFQMNVCHVFYIHIWLQSNKTHQLDKVIPQKIDTIDQKPIT